MKIACRIGHGRTVRLALGVLLVSAAVSLGCAASGLSGVGATAGGLGFLVSTLLVALSASSSLGGCDCGYSSRRAGDADADTDADTDTDTGSVSDTETPTDDWCLDYGCLDTDTDTDGDTDTDTDTDTGTDTGGTDVDAGPDPDGGFYCLNFQPGGEPQFSSAPDARDRARTTALERLEDRGTLPADLAERVRRLRARKS